VILKQKVVATLMAKSPLSIMRWFMALGDIGATWETSNAANLSQLGGAFDFTGAGGFAGLGVSWSRFRSTSSSVSGTDWTIGMGAGVGAQFTGGRSYTFVRVFPTGSLAANVGSAEIHVMDLFNPFSWLYGI
jgi:hypothetical protein